MIAFSGVRSSWLIVARKEPFARLAATATARARSVAVRGHVDARPQRVTLRLDHRERLAERLRAASRSSSPAIKR